jgi:hypothetical protein
MKDAKPASKKKPRAKSKAVVKKSPKESAAEIAVAQKRPNKHRAYLKLQKDEQSLVPADGKDHFYMGTHDDDLTGHIVDQIVGTCFTQYTNPERKVRNTNATLAALLEIDPQDSTELMLATQMVTVHNTAMKLSSHALKDGQSIEMANFYLNSATKLMRTYTTQMEALSKYRNKGKQQITVKHQNVNVNDGGQAIVGDVTQGGGNG